jgi:hypothetical protein
MPCQSHQDPLSTKIWRPRIEPVEARGAPAVWCLAIFPAHHSVRIWLRSLTCGDMKGIGCRPSIRGKEMRTVTVGGVDHPCGWWRLWGPHATTHCPSKQRMPDDIIEHVSGFRDETGSRVRRSQPPNMLWHTHTVRPEAPGMHSTGTAPEKHTLTQ